MKQMKRIFPLLTLLFCMLTACNEEEEKTKGSTKCLTVTETTGTGEERVTTEQQFIYTDGQLTQHVTTQTYTDRWLQAEYTQTVSTQLRYEPGKVIITDEDGGSVSTYLLDENGRATHCTRDELGDNVRTYTFSYSSETGNLSGIKESINESPYSEISITTLNDGTMNITEKTDIRQGTFTAGFNDNYPGVSNAMSRLPYLLLSERYPLSFHVEALYANLLGEPVSVLPGRLTIEGSDEITTYSYATDATGYITSCAITTSVPGRSWGRSIQYSYTND